MPTPTRAGLHRSPAIPGEGGHVAEESGRQLGGPGSSGREHAERRSQLGQGDAVIVRRPRSRLPRASRCRLGRRGCGSGRCRGVRTGPRAVRSPPADWRLAPPPTGRGRRPRHGTGGPVARSRRRSRQPSRRPGRPGSWSGRTASPRRRPREPGVCGDVRDLDGLAGQGYPTRDAAADREHDADDVIGAGPVRGHEAQVPPSGSTRANEQAAASKAARKNRPPRAVPRRPVSPARWQCRGHRRGGR